MPSTTTKYALRSPIGTEAADGPGDIQRLAQDVDANMAGYLEGTRAARPAASKNGRIYRATDTGEIFLDTGAAWIDLIKPVLPRARVFHTVAQSIPNATTTTLAFDSERWDTDAIHDPAANNSRLTAKTPGLYVIFGHAQFAAGGTQPGVHQLQIRLNGVDLIAVQQLDQVSTANTVRLTVMTEWEMALNDYVELRAFQQAGAAKNVDVSPKFTPEFGMSLAGGS